MLSTQKITILTHVFDKIQRHLVGTRIFIESFARQYLNCFGQPNKAQGQSTVPEYFLHVVKWNRPQFVARIDWKIGNTPGTYF